MVPVRLPGKRELQFMGELPTNVPARNHGPAACLD
jgi:hypothetical protein